MNLGKNKFFKMSLILSFVLELWYLWLTFCEYFKNDAWQMAHKPIPWYNYENNSFKNHFIKRNKATKKLYAILHD